VEVELGEVVGDLAATLVVRRANGKASRKVAISRSSIFTAPEMARRSW